MTTGCGKRLGQVEIPTHEPSSKLHRHLSITLWRQIWPTGRKFKNKENFSQMILQWIFQSFTQSVSSQKSKQNMFKQFTLIFHSLCPDWWLCAKGIMLISDPKNLVSKEMLAAVADKSRREILTISMLDGCFEGWIKCLMTVNWRLD